MKPTIESGEGERFVTVVRRRDDDRVEITVELEKRGVVTRPFPGEGIRVTIGTAEENDRFLQALADVI